MSNVTPVVVAVLVAELVPAAIFGFAAERVAAAIARWPIGLRLIAPAVLVAPYAVLASWQHMFRWEWFGLYAVLPVMMAWLLERAAAADPEQRGNWRDALILLTLGLAVDLRWLDMAWPAGLRGLGNLLLVDAGLYGFLGVRRMNGTGFDFIFMGATGRRGCASFCFSRLRCSCWASRSDLSIRMRMCPARARRR
jgi:CAAX protease family protein